MATGVTNFPTALDTAASILDAVNDASSLLAASISSSDTSLTVADASLFPTAGIARIDDEFLTWTGKSTNTLTGLVRGFDGSTAAAHAATADAKMTVAAGYHNVLADALIAIETKLGYGSDVAAANEALLATGTGQSGWAQITNAYIASGAAIAITKLAITGTPDGSKFLRDDGSWQTASGTGITALTGDVTASGSGSVVATIANDAVTFAKMLNSTAASVLIGRGSASGAGDFQEITLGSGLTMTGTVLSASGGGGAAWSALTDPAGNLSLAMATHLTTLTWAGNFGASSAFKLAGNNTSATGPLLHLTTAASNLIPPLLVEPRGGQRLKVGHLGDVAIGQGSMGAGDTDGFPFVPTIGSNSFPTSTPTGQTGFAPIVAYSNGINTEYDLAIYLNSKWNSIGGARKRYDTSSGTGAQTIDFNSNAGANVTRRFTFGAGNATFTFSNPPPAGSLITFIQIQDSTGARTPTYPSSVKWANGVAPTWSVAANAKDIMQFVWDGSEYLETSRTLGAA